MPRLRLRLRPLLPIILFSVLFYYLALRPSPPSPPLIRGLSVFPLSPNLKKHLVLASTLSSNTSWVSTLPPWLGLSHTIYVTDSPSHPFPNKGNEAMVYLSHLIAHYDSLPDVTIFTHAHNDAWHNNPLHYHTMPLMLRELNYRRVIAKGYMNLRCNWFPGCPDWIQPGSESGVNSNGVQRHAPEEETAIKSSWAELFPRRERPAELGVACCAQFAVSRAAVRRNEKRVYEHWRKWSVETELEDRISGRVLEYLWHVLFTGQEKVCPFEHVCACDGYGACFGEVGYGEWKASWEEARKMEKQLQLAEELGLREEEDPMAREIGMGKLRRDIDAKNQEVRGLVDLARERGKDPKVRREEVGDEEFTG